MKKSNGLKKVVCGMVIAFALMILGGNTLTTNAASYKTVYKKLLKQGNRQFKVKSQHGTYTTTISMKYFTLVNIDRKGAPELITLSEPYGNWIDVFTIKNGKLKYLGKELNKYMGGYVRYNPSKKGLVVAAGGSGSAGDALIQMSGNGLKEKVSTLQIFNQKTTYMLNYKTCSYKTYKKYTKKYFAKKNIKLAYFVENNKFNRSKKLK